MAESSEAYIIKYVGNCKREAEAVKSDRMDLNKDNYAMYQLRHDFRHKTEGQTTEVLPKVRMAVEQAKSFFQQAIADLGEWFNIEIKDTSIPEDALPIKPHEAKAMLAYQHKKSSYFSHVGNSIQSGLLGALIITKTDGKMVPQHKFEVKKSGKGKSFQKNVVAVEDKTWRLNPCVLRQEDYYPDPTGKDLYEIEYMEMDLHEVIAKSKGEDAIYDPEVVAMLSREGTKDTLRDNDKYRETGQNTSDTKSRPVVRILEFWGSVIGDDGDMLHENVIITIANDTYLIRKPEPNGLWHQKSPINRAPILEVANSVWPIALMDAPTKIARTIIELHNLVIDAAFKRVHAISQIRVNDLADPSQVSEGIPPGTKLLVKSSLPVGGKVMEALEEADIPQDALNILNIEQQEFNAAALTNDLRQGVLSFRAVKATEVVEASQNITSMFQGMAKNIESKHIEPELELQWMTIAQNWNKISKAEFVALYGVERGSELHQLDSQDVFVSSVNGFKFEVFGISQTLAKAQDFRKLTTLLQTISASDVLIEEFIRKYDFGKLLGEIMGSLDIDKNKIAIDKAAEPAQPGGPQQLPPGGPNGDMSGVAPPSAPGLADVFGEGLPTDSFPQPAGPQ